MPFNVLPNYLHYSTTVGGLDSRVDSLSGYTNQFLVHKTGNEFITGDKTFVNGIRCEGSVDTQGLGVNTISLLDSDVVFDLQTSDVFDNGSNVSLNWNNRILSGEWNVERLKISGLSVSTGGYFTGVGFLTSGYIPKSTTDGKGFINSNIIDSGNSVNIITTLNMGANALNCGAITSTNTLQVGAGNYILWNARSRMYSLANGNVTFSNNGFTDFGRLNFGGDTIGFPAIKRSGDALALRTATDSRFTQLITNHISDISGSFGIGISGNNIGIRTALPISTLDVSGHILAGNITGENFQLGKKQSDRINLLGGASGSAPVNTATPFGWHDILISGQAFKIPIYL